MPVRELLRALGLFALLVVVVVGGAALGPSVMGESPTPYQPVENDQFQPANVLPADDAESGTVTMERTDGNKTVVFDMAHGNAVDESDVDPLVSALVRNGYRVRFHRGGSLNASLRRADAFVVVNPREPFTPEEAAGLNAFTEAGGRLALLADPPTTTVEGGLFSVSFDTIGSTGTSVSSSHGLAFGDGYLYNMAENDAHFKSVYAEGTGDTGLAAGVDRLVVREAVPVTVDDDAAVVARAGGETTLSTTRRTGEYAVVARSGPVVAVGDTDFLTSESVTAADNEVFVGNLADFLVSGEKEAGAPKPPSDESEPRRPPADPRASPGSDSGATTAVATETTA